MADKDDYEVMAGVITFIVSIIVLIIGINGVLFESWKEIAWILIWIGGIGIVVIIVILLVVTDYIDIG